MGSFIKRFGIFMNINFGCLIFSLAYIFFFHENLITPGGLAGLAIVFQYLTDISFGIINVALNCPAIIIGVFLLGPKSIGLTIYSIFASSIMIDIGNGFLPVFTENTFLAALIGGVLQGIGLGILFNANVSIGGTALIGLLVNYKFPRLKLGTVLMIVDGAVVLFSFFTFQDFVLASASGVAVFITTMMINQIVNQNSVIVQTYLFMKAKLYQKLSFNNYR